MRNIEHEIQKSVVRYLAIQYPNIKFTISPQGMKLNIYIAKLFKELGYSKGTPDILIFAARKGYFGLLIELKRPEIRGYSEKGKETQVEAPGSVSQEQQAWIDYLNKEGYKAVVCFGSQMAYRVIDEYFKSGVSK